ncbi:uncharacterized protein [Prorops nasuta]|uniref:uncharacterized protein n=1 Tax=Prorops nasuta TaxID=863751 RepID=UPI0034CDA84D
MVDRVKLIIQKRTTFKSQLTIVCNMLEKEDVDPVVINLRVKRLSELYNALEEAMDELLVLDLNENHTKEFQTIQERFYNIASKVQKLHGVRDIANTSTASGTDEIRSDNAPTVVPRNEGQNQKLKLPKITLQNFDGRYENWLTFKNMFLNIIDVRSDLTDLDKFHYLKSVVIGEAAKKLEVFTVHPNSYKKAWEVLTRLYEVKRILVSQHISLMFELPALKEGTSAGFSKLADDMQQHIASLNALGVVVSPEIAIHIIETRLPKVTLKEWESTLKRDEMPSLENLFEFLYKSAVCASRQERIRPAEIDTPSEVAPTKKKRHNTINKGFVLSVTPDCSVCRKAAHPWFKCEAFRQLTVPKRIKAIKTAKVCFNCLRSHKGKPCRSSGCVICSKRHNTLIHVNNRPQETKQEIIKETQNNTASSS